MAHGQRHMSARLDQNRRTLSVILGALALVDVAALLVWDAFPQLFPARSHEVLAAYALAMIAIAYLSYQAMHRPLRAQFLKAVLLAVAFLFWAANQLWPNLPQATLFNDIAIALFVFDVFLIMVGRPASSQSESFAESYADARGQRRF